MTDLELFRSSLPDKEREPLPADKSLHLMIPGAPRTKKNSAQIFRNIVDGFFLKFVQEFLSHCWPWLSKGTWSEHQIMEWIKERGEDGYEGYEPLPHPTLLPSANYLAWEKASIALALPILERCRSYLPITYAVHVYARIYRDADRGDWVGYTQAIGDFLEKAGVLKDDEQIKSWDGTRVLKDSKNPRIELWISEHTIENDADMFAQSAQYWAKYTQRTPDIITLDPPPDASPFRPVEDSLPRSAPLVSAPRLGLGRYLMPEGKRNADEQTD